MTVDVLIGGKNAGKVVNVLYDLERLYMPTPEGKVETYRRHRLGGSGRTFDVWALDGLTGDDIIEELLNIYCGATSRS